MVEESISRPYVGPPSSRSSSSGRQNRPRPPPRPWQLKGETDLVEVQFPKTIFVWARRRRRQFAVAGRQIGPNSHADGIMEMAHSLARSEGRE